MVIQDAGAAKRYGKQITYEKVLTAEKLKETGAKEIYLAVTQCENTIFEI
ncbi:hypothetical protein [Clostridium sp. 'White wine YQ']